MGDREDAYIEIFKNMEYDFPEGKLKKKKDAMLQRSEELKDMPNQRWHKIISFIKSGIRILGYAFIPFDLVVATLILIISEVTGIIEELV